MTVTPHAPPPVPARSEPRAPNAALGGALPLREVLRTPSLTGSTVLAGAGGLDREVERLNVMEVPDISRWVKPREFLLTTAYPLRGRPDSLAGLVAELDEAGLAGLGIKLGRYLDEAPADMLAAAEERDFPLVQLPDDVGFDEILHEVLTGILNRQAQQLARSERVHRAFLQLVLHGHGLPEIVRDLAELVDAPVAIVDLEGQVLAYAGVTASAPGDEDAASTSTTADAASTSRTGKASGTSRAGEASATSRAGEASATSRAGEAPGTSRAGEVPDTSRAGEAPGAADVGVIVAPDRTALVVAPDRIALDLAAGTATLADGTTLGDRPVPCTAVPISAGPREHGHVVALAVDGDPIDDLVALENAATVAALSMTQRLEVQAVEDKYRSDLMHDLLRAVDDPADVRRRAAGFGWDLDRRLIVLVVRLDTPPDPVIPDEVTRRTPLMGAMRRAVLDRDPVAAIARFSHEAVIVTAAFDGPTGRDEARRFCQRLIDEGARASGRSVSGGLSRPVTELTAIARAYDQATRALVIGRRIHGPGALAHFDDLGAYRVLSLVEDHEELRSFAAEVLGELATDTATAADLRRTLQTLLETGGNVAEAARQLHFHYNTLRYRVEKLESIVGPFTTDARIRLDVHLALMVFAMRGLDPAGRDRTSAR